MQLIIINLTGWTKIQAQFTVQAMTIRPFNIIIILVIDIC